MLLGYLTLLVLGFAGNVLVALALHRTSGSGVLAGSEIVAFTAALAAGATTARIARTKPLAHAGALALSVFSVTIVAALIAPAPHQAVFPPWYPYVAALLGGAGAFAGGALAVMREDPQARPS